jgi:hypothetical protein
MYEDSYSENKNNIQSLTCERNYVNFIDKMYLFVYAYNSTNHCLIVAIQHNVVDAA